MSTNDVPGFREENNDELAMGCWAEHEDGSLIFVESVEGGRVIYSVFDVQPEPIVEYRDAMSENGFKDQFSWNDEDDERWTWHDKTPFPWDRIIRRGSRHGPRHASAEDLMTAAQRVARSRDLRGDALVEEDMRHRRDDFRGRVRTFVDKLQKAIDALGD